MMQLDPSYDRQVRQVAGTDAAALVAGGIRVLDVRTPQEFSALGHIPGALLLPVQIIASAPAILGDADTPVLVTCEHAVRSKVATRLLAQAGFTQVYELAHGMATVGRTASPRAAGDGRPVAVAVRVRRPRSRELAGPLTWRADAVATRCCWPRRGCTSRPSIATRTPSRACRRRPSASAYRYDPGRRPGNRRRRPR